MSALDKPFWLIFRTLCLNAILIVRYKFIYQSPLSILFLNFHVNSAVIACNFKINKSLQNFVLVQKYNAVSIKALRLYNNFGREYNKSFQGLNMNCYGSVSLKAMQAKMITKSFGK